MPTSAPAHADSSCPPRPCRRGGCLAAALAACAVLAGCAGQSGERQADATSAWEINARHAQDDPIGALLQRNRKYGYRHQAASPGGETEIVQDTAAIAPLADTAMQMLGIRYRWGGGDPSTGFDCSGLVAYAAEQSLGLRLPRRADEIARQGVSVKRAELQAGDLVFFNTMGRRYSHVGIYLGDDRFVHAPSSGGVVRVERMDMHYWAKRYNGARRLVAAR